MSRLGRKWQASEDAVLIDKALAGLNAQEIEKLLPGRPPEGVYSRARALRSKGVEIPLPKLDRSKTQDRSSEDESMIGRAGLLAQSLPLNRIAEAFK